MSILGLQSSLSAETRYSDHKFNSSFILIFLFQIKHCVCVRKFDKSGNAWAYYKFFSRFCSRHSPWCTCIEVSKYTVAHINLLLHWYDIEFFRTHYGPGLESASKWNEQRRPVRKADNLTTFVYQLFRNLGASTSWNPQGLSRPV
jgi:hypothetical protein